MIVRIVPIVPVVSKNVQTIGTIIWKRYPDDRKRPGRLRRSGRSKAIPEDITFIPVIENIFGPDGAEAEKIIHKCSQRVCELFEIRESP